MTRIVLDRLTKTFPTQPTPVLRGLSLDVHAGELVALLGPSGSGKSTILKLIAGIEQPDSGDVRFDEQSLVPVPPHRRGAVLMFQKAYLFPFLNVADNIGFGLKLRSTPKQQQRAAVARMLELVELPGIERKYPSQLSGGEQQRVALARALVVQPRVLLLDEPLSSLDTAIRHTLQETIRRVQRELGITTLLVTHDLHEAIAMSDRTALLLDGMIEAYDRPEHLFQNPPTRAAASFMGISTFLTGCLSGEHLRGPWGTLRVSMSSGPRREATFAIRPEHVAVRDAASDNSLPGIVHSVQYKGEYTAYEVVVGHVPVRIRAYQEVRRYPAGAAVHVHVPVEKLFEVQ
ncbi:MAG: ABC transporter ATP-binding protein [Chloroflexota bacterium]|nr:ABC transporter ATP-binding protein [Chloroflexota bacterium]